MTDAVERDVDPPDVPNDRVGVRIDGGLVECVHLGRLHGPAPGRDLLGHRVEGRTGPAGQEDPGPLPGEGQGHRPPHGASGPVHHSVPVLEQHGHPPLACDGPA